jgi:hypothetical protein
VWNENRSGKENLLITIGDSWTEGVGCYDTEYLLKHTSGQVTAEELYKESRKRKSFFKNSWPMILSQKLDYDLLNMGLGGSSNSGAAKRLIYTQSPQNTLYSINRIEEFKLAYKKITIIWMLTEDMRFSFYSDKNVTDYQSWGDNPIYNLYIEKVNVCDEDGYFETIFYLEAVRHYCISQGFNFFYCSGFSNIKNIMKYYNTENNIHNYTEYTQYSDMLRETKFFEAPQDVWAFCKHPNELGYKIIADNLYNILTTHFNGRF